MLESSEKLKYIHDNALVVGIDERKDGAYKWVTKLSQSYKDRDDPDLCSFLLCSFFASKSQRMIFLVFWLHVHRNGQKGRNSFVLNLVFTNVIEALLLLFTVSVKNHQPKLEREMEVLKKKKKLTPGK